MPKTMKIPSKFEGQDEVPLASDISWIFGDVGRQAGETSSQDREEFQKHQNQRNWPNTKANGKGPKANGARGHIFFVCQSIHQMLANKAFWGGPDLGPQWSHFLGRGCIRICKEREYVLPNLFVLFIIRSGSWTLGIAHAIVKGYGRLATQSQHWPFIFDGRRPRGRRLRTSVRIKIRAATHDESHQLS